MIWGMKRQFGMTQWLLAEQLRLVEEAHGRSRNDEAANAVARANGGDLAQRVVQRASAMPDASGVLQDLHALRFYLKLLVSFLGLLGCAGGLGAAMLSIQSREIEVLAVVASVLAIPTVVLVIWVIIALAPVSKRPSGFLEIIVSQLAKAYPVLGLKGPSQKETVRACLNSLGTPAGRWILSAISHGFWLLYLLSALVLLTIILSVSQYDLGWGSTLLSEAMALSLLRDLSYLPQLLGLVPTQPDQWLASGRMGAPTLVMYREQWSAFLLALIFVYGLLPRLIFFLASVLLAWHLSQRMTVSVELPGHFRLKGILMPESLVAEDTKVERPWVPRALRAPPRGASDCISLSIELGPSIQVPPLGQSSNGMLHLGCVDTRDEQRRVLAALNARTRPVRYLIVFCSYQRTPDQGLSSLINDFADVAGGGLLIVLADLGQHEQSKCLGGSRYDNWVGLSQQTGGQLLCFDELPLILSRR